MCDTQNRTRRMAGVLRNVGHVCVGTRKDNLLVWGQVRKVSFQMGNEGHFQKKSCHIEALLMTFMPT